MNSNLSFKTFYASKEESNCPFIVKALEIGKEFEKKDLPINSTDIIISFKYGKRVLINAENTDLKYLKRKDFLEIIDYDPLKKVMFLMGSKIPRIDSSVHWLIHHAREEVNAVIQINDEKITEKLENKLPVTEKKYPDGTIEYAKEILKLLRDSKNIIISGKGLLLVEGNIDRLKKNMLKTLEESK